MEMFSVTGDVGKETFLGTGVEEVLFLRVLSLLHQCERN